MMFGITDDSLEQIKTALENDLINTFLKSVMPKSRKNDTMLRVLDAFNRRGVSSMTVLVAIGEAINDGAEENDDICCD